MNCLKGKAQGRNLRIWNPEPQLLRFKLRFKPRRFRSEPSANPIGVFAIDAAASTGLFCGGLSPRRRRFNILRIGGGDMKSYRTLVLKYRVEKLPPEAAEKVAQLLKAQVEFRRWAWEWARSGGKTPEQRPLKYFAEKFIHAARAFDWLRSHVVKHGFRPPLVFDAQLRLDNERCQLWRLCRLAETGG